MGRSRGGLTTTIHPLVDGRGLPVQLHLSEGQASDCKQADPLLDAVPKGSILLADKAYDSDAIRETVEARGGSANIPAKSNRKKSFTFSAFLYRYRNLIERFFEKSNMPEAWPHDTKSGPTTSSPQSNCSQRACGLPLVSLRPRPV